MAKRFQADYLKFDDREPITLLITAPTGSDWQDDGSIDYTENSSEERIDDSLFRQVSAKDIVQSGGQLRIGDVWIIVWRLSIDGGDIDDPQRPELEPVKGMQFRRDGDPGEIYEILGVDFSQFTGKFRCHCRR